MVTPYVSLTGKQAVRLAHGCAGMRGWNKRMPPCNGVDRGCVTGNITPRESGQTSIWSFITRELDQPLWERRQMTAGQPTGALSTPEDAWHTTIDWYAVHRTVQRLQARIVKVVHVA
jgi:hypothetical protein